MIRLLSLLIAALALVGGSLGDDGQRSLGKDAQRSVGKVDGPFPFGCAHATDNVNGIKAELQTLRAAFVRLEANVAAFERALAELQDSVRALKLGGGGGGGDEWWK